MGKAEFLAPDGLLAFVRRTFVAAPSAKGPVPDIRRDKEGWFAYFDDDGSGELSMEEVVRGLVKSLKLSADLAKVI